MYFNILPYLWDSIHEQRKSLTNTELFMFAIWLIYLELITSDDEQSGDDDETRDDSGVSKSKKKAKHCAG